MSNVMNVILMQEVYCHSPWAWTDNFIYPFAMHQDFSSLLFIHNNFTFLLNSLSVSTHSHNQMCIWEQLFCLLENFSMSNMEHVKNSISIHSHWIVRISSIWLYIFLTAIYTYNARSRCNNRFHMLLLAIGLCLNRVCWLLNFLVLVKVTVSLEGILLALMVLLVTAALSIVMLRFPIHHFIGRD